MLMQLDTTETEVKNQLSFIVSSMEYSNYSNAAALVMFLFLAVLMCSSSHVIVSKDENTGNYTSVAEAVRNAPDLSDQTYIIRVLAGIYEECVLIPPNKTNIKLLGDGSNQTIIVGHQNGSVATIGTLPNFFFSLNFQCMHFLYLILILVIKITLILKRWSTNPICSLLIK
jgi:pectin methylesterase-like acyl-CoA thioesterase